MLIIPAIDVSAGRLARLRSGAIEPVTAFDGDPLAAAHAFIEAGATWLHVVDMDLAFTGEATALDTMAAIATLGVPVQGSGGLSSLEEVSAVLEAGAARAVLGSAALADRGLVGRAIAMHGERLAIGIETEDGSIRPRGRWGQAPLAALGIDGVIGDLVAEGVRRLVVTVVDRVGSLEGAGSSTIARVRSLAPGVPVLASGGVAGLTDLLALAASGIEGTVVGSALYHGDLDLRDAIVRLRDMP